jgi:molybdopterin biosynthesis enzyme
MVHFIELLMSFLKVGSFSFGGAYSLIPLIEKEVVINHQWLSNDANRANCLIVVDENTRSVAKGEEVECIIL